MFMGIIPPGTLGSRGQEHPAQHGNVQKLGNPGRLEQMEDPRATPPSWGFQGKNQIIPNSQLPLWTVQGLTPSEPNAKALNEFN